MSCDNKIVNSSSDEVFKIENLTMAYDNYVVMQDLNFTVKKARYSSLWEVVVAEKVPCCVI